MELKDFITETLKQLVDGVEEAQKYIVDKQKKATINPKGMHNNIETVDFDVAVTSTENVTNSVSGGIRVASIFSIGGENKNNTLEQNISRSCLKLT